MSQTTLTPNQLKTWLENETGSILTPVQTQAQKHLDETRTALQNLTEASKMIQEVSQKEIDKRNTKAFNRARALNKLAVLFLDRLKKLRIPDQISYDLFNVFGSETQKTMTVFEVDIRNWFPHISPFFIMDRRKFQATFEKSKFTVNAFYDFVNKEYVKSKTLEKTFQLVNELETLERQSVDLQTEKANLKNERLIVESEIAGLEAQTLQLKSKAALDSLSQLDAEQEALNNELKQCGRHLQKPLLKMQALATSGGGGGITPDELKMISLYMDNPFEAISSEQADCPVLRSILEKMSNLLAEDKLKLKPDKHRKAEQTIAEFLKTDTLTEMRNKSVVVAAHKTRILNSAELEEARRSLSLLEQQVETLKARQSNLEADERVKENQHQDLQSKIGNLKRTIQANIADFSNKQVQIQ